MHVRRGLCIAFAIIPRGPFPQQIPALGESYPSPFPNPLSARRWRSGAFDHLEEILEASKVQRVSQQSSRFPKTARTNVNTTNNCTCFVSIGTCTLQCTTLPITALFHKRSLTMKNHWTSDVIDIFKHRARFRESGPVNCLQLELHHHLDTCQLSTDIISCLSC